MSFLKKNSYTIILIVLSISSALIISTMGSPDHELYQKIEVSKGETIWLYAEKYSENTKLSKKEFVKWIQEENNIANGTIYEGQELILPIEKEEFFKIAYTNE